MTIDDAIKRFVWILFDRFFIAFILKGCSKIEEPKRNLKFLFGFIIFLRPRLRKARY